jgi:predicted glycosyltransferase involved in capsule biosynthesis
MNSSTELRRVKQSYWRDSYISKNNKIDILLISESHTTEQSINKIQYYTIYYANHPDGTANAGSALIIKSQLNLI